MKTTMIFVIGILLLVFSYNAFIHKAKEYPLLIKNEPLLIKNNMTAKQIAEKYGMLEECNALYSRYERQMVVFRLTLDLAGIDRKEVDEYVKNLIETQKATLEKDLGIQ